MTDPSLLLRPEHDGPSALAPRGPDKPLAIDLFCGLFGWSAGLVAEGWRTVGFDLEDMGGQFGIPRPPDTQLVIQDVLTLHGSQFRSAQLIVASPPCQAYSYRAMPWKRAKALPPPDNTLFEACFRIQREACEAAGHHIPLIVENVRGAQKWVGRARWNFGSFYLWGDVPALMPPRLASQFNKIPAAINEGIRNGRSPTRGTNRAEDEGVKQRGSGAAWFDQALDERRAAATAIKNGGDWFSSGDNCSAQRRASSGSTSRKFASAMIAKIPLSLSRHIAATFKPRPLAVEFTNR